jgi:hypothetical protein
MPSFPRSLFLACVVVMSGVSLASQAQAGPSVGELNLALGARFPQGSFTDWADDGGSAWARINVRPFRSRAFSVWVDGDLTLFGFSSEPVVAIVDDTLVLPAQQDITQTSFSLHTGLQMGSKSTKAFFRPRAAIAPGIYFYNVNTSVRLLDTEEAFLSDDLLQVRFGWRAVAGTDLFFTHSWGLSLDFTYEAVWNVHHVAPSDAQGQSSSVDETARYIGFMVGLTIPINVEESTTP